MSSMSHRRSVVLSSLIAALAAGACSHGPPPAPPAPPPPLRDSAAAALAWVEAHAARFNPEDSLPNAALAQALAPMIGDASVIGVSELTEGTHEFPTIMRQMLFSLADDNVRGLAIQGPMPEAMEVDRYVRTGIGDPKRLLHALGSWRWETREMLDLVRAMRAWNQSHPADRQLGFYGFEIPSGKLALRTVTTVPDSVMGASLNAWLKHEYACVATDEQAEWGAEGRAVDRPYWDQCRSNVDVALDSVVARRARGGFSTRAASEFDFAEQMARLLKHYVGTGLMHLPREATIAQHTLFLDSLLGPGAKLIAWGGDIEAGRLTQVTTKQMGLPLGQLLGEKYRNIAFAFGTGAVRAHRPSVNVRRNGDFGPGGGGQSGLTTVPVARPEPGSYEDVLSRAGASGYWLDARQLPQDKAGEWLRGPHAMRLITETYAPQAPQLFDTPIELPKYYDLVLFVATVRPPM
jgi:erythromycin esterase